MLSAKSSTEKLKDAKPINVSSPLLPLQEYEGTYVRVAYGAANDNDFVLHIEPMHPSAPFPKMSDAFKIMQKHLDPKLPLRTKVEIIPPNTEWAVQYTVLIAHGVMQQWSFDEKEIEAALPGLVEELDKVIHAARERRRLGR